MVGAGVHTGEAFVGVVGGDEKTDFTALGDTVNIAARLGGLAGPGELLVSRLAWDRAGLGAPPRSARSRSPDGPAPWPWCPPVRASPRGWRLPPATERRRIPILDVAVAGACRATTRVPGLYRRRRERATGKIVGVEHRFQPADRLYAGRYRGLRLPLHSTSDSQT